MSIEIKDAGITLKSNKADFETAYQKFILKKVSDEHKLDKAERIGKLVLIWGTCVVSLILIVLYAFGLVPALGTLFSQGSVIAGSVASSIAAGVKYLMSRKKE